MIAAIDQLRALGLSATGTLEEMAALLQQMAVRQAVPDAVDGDDPDAAGSARLAALLPADETQLLYSIVLHGRAEIGLAPDEYSGLVMVLLRMLAFAPQGSEPASVVPAGPAGGTVSPVPRAAVAQPRRVQTPVAVPTAHPPVRPDAMATATATPPTATAPSIATTAAALFVAAASAGGAAPVVASGSVPLQTELGTRWAETVQRLCAAGSIAALVRELAMQAQCVAIEDAAMPPVWRLRVERETLRAPGQRDKLQAALGELLGQGVRIEVEAGPAEDTPARRDAAERARRLAEAERTIQNDPLVQALMAQYKTARIVPGSVRSL